MLKKYLWLSFYFALFLSFSFSSTNVFLDVDSSESKIMVGDLVNTVNGETGDVVLTTNSITGFVLRTGDTSTGDQNAPGFNATYGITGSTAIFTSKISVGTTTVTDASITVLESINIVDTNDAIISMQDVTGSTGVYLNSGGKSYINNSLDVIGFSIHITTIQASDYTATALNDVILATGTITVTLPAKVNAYNDTRQAGKIITIKNVGAGTVTIDGNDANIDGVATVDSTSQYDSYDVIRSSTSWWIR